MRGDVRGRLVGRVVVVVGGGQTPGATIGNGRAAALLYARAGARVLVVDRLADRAEAVAGEIEAEGGIAQACAADASREAGARTIVQAALDAFDALDVLHNNVGIGAGDASPTRITEDGLDRVLRVNLSSVVFTCKYALPVLRERGGVITNLSSAAAVCTYPLVGYKTSKAALNAYSQSLAVANAAHGVRVNVVAPGLVHTPMAIEGLVARGRDRDALIAERDAQVPLAGGMGDAWDVAHAALFLATDEARFVTGVVLPVDGGQSARVG